MELRLDAEAVQQGFRIGLGLPAVHLGKFRLQLACPDPVLIGKVLFCVESIFFGADLEQPGISLNDRIQDDLVVVFVVILLQEGETLPFGDRDTSIGRLKLSREYAQEGGFAGTVRTDDSVAVSFCEFDRDIFKQCFFAKAECNAVCCDHICFPFFFEADIRICLYW